MRAVVRGTRDVLERAGRRGVAHAGRCVVVLSRIRIMACTVLAEELGYGFGWKSRSEWGMTCAISAPDRDDPRRFGRDAPRWGAGARNRHDIFRASGGVKCCAI